MKNTMPEEGRLGEVRDFLSDNNGWLGAVLMMAILALGTLVKYA